MNVRPSVGLHNQKLKQVHFLTISACARSNTERTDMIYLQGKKIEYGQPNSFVIEIKLRCQWCDMVAPQTPKTQQMQNRVHATHLTHSNEVTFITTVNIFGLSGTGRDKPT